MLVRQSPSGQILGFLTPAFFGGSDFDDPNTADWAVNGVAALAADSNNDALDVRLFDDSSEEGVGWTAFVPAECTAVIIHFVSRAETAPGIATVVQPMLYTRSIPNNVVMGAWNGMALDLIDIPANELWQYDRIELSRTLLNLAGGEYAQFQLTRDGLDPNDTLVGDWTLLCCRIELR